MNDILVELKKLNVEDFVRSNSLDERVEKFFKNLPVITATEKSQNWNIRMKSVANKYISDNPIILDKEIKNLSLRDSVDLLRYLREEGLQVEADVIKSIGFNYQIFEQIEREFVSHFSDDSESSIINALIVGQFKKEDILETALLDFNFLSTDIVEYLKKKYNLLTTGGLLNMFSVQNENLLNILTVNKVLLCKYTAELNEQLINNNFDKNFMLSVLL